MEFRGKRLTVAEAKSIDMVDCLIHLGHQATKVRGNDYWYHSPLREEKTPSFKVNRELNRWFDHGIGKGGNLVDFVVVFWGCPVSEALFKLGGNFSFQQQPTQPLKVAAQKQSQVKILKAFLLSSKALLNYLERRSIPAGIASEFCCELRFELAGKTWYGIGFKNDLGGYEIRNAFQKLSNAPKGITTIKNNRDTVAIFEGFFDFLSFIAIAGETCCKQLDFIILNSLAFIESIRPLLAGYGNAYTFFDNDAAGKAATNLSLSWCNHYHDKSKIYEGYTDLNEWLIKAPDHLKAEFRAGFMLSDKPPNFKDCAT